MNKLSKEKRNQLILIAIVTIGALAGIWTGLISYQRGRLEDVSRRIAAIQQEIDKTQKVIHDANQLEADLKLASARLETIENGMPAGDLFSFLVGRIRQFNTPSYRVDMPQIGLPVIGEVTMLPDFPYNQAAVSVTGTAYYWDLGKFIADFENHFPYSRIENLSLEPGGGGADEKEKLTFHMQIVSLIKRNNS